jgi:rhodanese-related sulfurtransferase
MDAVKRTVLEALLLGVVGLAVAFTANAVRASASIELSKNYFVVWVDNEPDTPPVESDDPPDTDSASDKPPDHPYQEVTFEDVVEVFNDPNTEMGINLFVDARNDDAYEEGHIPGAIQADHYRLEDYIDNLLDFAEAAEKIIVYCNGGDCEDSIFLCTDLMEFDVPFDSVYLYPGGWKEWTKNGMPIEKGREEEGEE